MQVQGKLQVIEATKEVGANKFPIREFVIKTDDQYPQELLIQLAGDSVTLIDKYNVGDNIIAHINLRGRKWINPQGEARYFNTIQAWRLGSVSNEVQDADAVAEEGDDPPF